MQVHIPGFVSRLSQIDVGACILFTASDGYHLGMVVGIGDNSKAVLDFESVDHGTEPRFQLYNANSFDDEPMISLTGARIVPSVAREHLGHGIHSSSRMSKAVYLTSDGLVVFAEHTRRTYKVNLSNGYVRSGDLAYDIHSTEWRIETADGAGKFSTYQSFTA